MTNLRRRRSFFGLACLLAVVASTIGSCSSSSGTVRGLVVSVDGSLTSVTSFTLLVEGEEMTFLPVEDGDYAFPLPHLGEHQRTGEPVVVSWEKRDGILYAVTVDDG